MTWKLSHTTSYATAGYMSAFLLSARRPSSTLLQHNLGMHCPSLLPWPYLSQSGLIRNIRDSNKPKGTDRYKRQYHSS